MSDKLDEVLDLDPEDGEIVNNNTKLVEYQENKIEKHHVDISAEADFRYARENLYMIVEIGNRNIEELEMIAQQSQQARAYEVLGSFLKTMLDANRKLLELQQMRKNLENEEQKQRPEEDRGAFLTNAELQEWIEKNRKKK